MYSSTHPVLHLSLCAIQVPATFSSVSEIAFTITPRAPEKRGNLVKRLPQPSLSYYFPTSIHCLPLKQAVPESKLPVSKGLKNN